MPAGSTKHRDRSAGSRSFCNNVKEESCTEKRSITTKLGRVKRGWSRDSVAVCSLQNRKSGMEVGIA